MSSQGPFVCSSGSTSVGTYSWTNPSNVTSTTAAENASCGVEASAQTENLIASFNAGAFTLPSNATVSGIEIDLEAQGPATSTLHASLSFGGTSKSLGTGGGFAALVFGGAADLWGNASITYSAVNGGWSVTLYGLSTSSPGAFQVYDVTATVTYTTSGGIAVVEEIGLEHWRLTMPGADGWW